MFHTILDALDDAEPLIYCAKSSTAEREAGCEAQEGQQRGNIHNCVKPLDLTRHLATLIAIPKLDRPRRLLCVFSGSGSEAIGAVLSGQWDEIVCVEQSPEYAAIAQARLLWWQQQLTWCEPDHTPSVDELLAAARKQPDSPLQISLFEE